MPRPNVLFVITDQHRWDFMGYEANGVTHTPNLNRLAGVGTFFRSAYCNAPLCTPSRMAIASGHRSRAIRIGMADRTPNLRAS